MTNDTIILNARLDLMEKGVIKGSGKFAEIINGNGELEEIELPEEIHTFKEWNERGYRIRRGSHAVATIYIWKFKDKERKAKEKAASAIDNAASIVRDNTDFVKVKAFFFSQSQVEPATA